MNFNQVSIPLSSMPGPVKLSEIVNQIAVVTLFGPWDAEIRGVTSDSRAVQTGWVFVAIAGEKSDGHDYVQKAMERGARVVVVSKERYEADLHRLLSASFVQHTQTTVLVVQDTRLALAGLASGFHGHPSRSMKMIGITGTNGKTTTAYLIKAGLEASGEKVGMIGTVHTVIGASTFPSIFTTPPADHLHGILAAMRAAGCTAVVMEVSSHALALGRVHGVMFDVTVYTNLTRDHLDYHADMLAYADAKALLFRGMTKTAAIVNVDDPWASRITAGAGRKRISCGVSARARMRILDITSTLQGSKIRLAGESGEVLIESRLLGDFNAYNLTLAYTACMAVGANSESVLRGIRRCHGAPGRFERITSKDGVTAVVDYSHTPDALQNALLTARRLVRASGRLIVVFGCGGDRDHGKRPLMGEIAGSLADLTILTSDNPRSEDPMAIVQAIREGLPSGASCIVEVHRRAAIRRALRMAVPGDLVLVAGKGHETYQILGTRRIQFDDREIVRSFFVEKRGGVKS